jgi:hypothetical protein
MLTGEDIMNANTKKLSIIAFAVSMALAAGGAWAVGNSITFDGEANVSNGVNNLGKIDAHNATNAVVVIRQINSEKDITNHHDTDETIANQVGDYVGSSGSALVLGGSGSGSNTLKVTIGQGATVDTAGTFLNDGATKKSLNNIVAGKISATAASTDVRISQLGITGAHAVYLGVVPAGTDLGSGAGVTGGNLTLTQSGNGNTVNLEAMSGGTLTATQSGATDTLNVTAMTAGSLTANQTGATEVLNVTANTGGTTVINQGQQVPTTGDTATNATLTFNGTVTSGKTYDVTVNQTGSYATNTLSYVGGAGYTGVVNMDNHGTNGTTPTTSTLDLKL